MSDRPSEVAKTCTAWFNGKQCTSPSQAECFTCREHANFSTPDGRQCTAIVGSSRTRCGRPAVAGDAGRACCERHKCEYLDEKGRGCRVKATNGSTYCGSHCPKDESAVGLAEFYGTIEMQQADLVEKEEPLDKLIKDLVTGPGPLPVTYEMVAWMLGRKDETAIRRYATGKVLYKSKLPKDVAWLDATTHKRASVLRRLVYHWMLRTGKADTVRVRLDRIGIAPDHHEAFIERDWARADRSEERVREVLLAVPFESVAPRRLPPPTVEIEDKAGGEEDEAPLLSSSMDLDLSTPETAPTTDAMDVTEEPVARPRALVPADYAAWLKPKVRDEVVAAAMEQLASALKEELGRGNTYVVNKWVAIEPTPHECEAILALIEGDELDVDLRPAGFELRYTPRPPVSRKRAAPEATPPPAKRARVD